MKNLIISIALFMIFPVLVILNRGNYLSMTFQDLALDYYFIIILLAFLNVIVSVFRNKFNTKTLVTILIFIFTVYFIMDSLNSFRTV
jgi:hypothetical protein